MKQETPVAPKGSPSQSSIKFLPSLPDWRQLLSLRWVRLMIVLALTGLWVGLAAMPVANG